MSVIIIQREDRDLPQMPYVRLDVRTIQNGVQTALKLKNRSLRGGEDFSSEKHRDGDLALKFPPLHRSGLERREEKEE